MTLDVGGHLCEDCEMERAMVTTVRSATLKQAVTAIPAGAPGVAILAGAGLYGLNIELFVVGGVAGGIALVHALYSLDAYLNQQRLPMREKLSPLQRFEPLVVASLMTLIGLTSGTIHLFGPLW